MPRSTPKPLIGLPACYRTIDGHPYHRIGDKYLRAVTEAAHGVPFIIPAFGEAGDMADLLDRIDGLMLTGSPSNVHPPHYGRDPHPEAEPYDHARDATTLPLIRAAIAAAVPLFAICRGIQELNVALGGTLFARVHELPGRRDHRRPKHEDPDVQYGPRHSVALTEGGALAGLVGGTELMVNSLHNQGLDRVAEGLAVEAVADDGTIEAVSVTGAKAFALGVQWHPEYKALNDPVSTRLFAAFGDAARARATARREGAPEASAAAE